jgi:hypothetical protein
LNSAHSGKSLDALPHFFKFDPAGMLDWTRSFAEALPLLVQSAV